MKISVKYGVDLKCCWCILQCTRNSSAPRGNHNIQRTAGSSKESWFHRAKENASGIWELYERGECCSFCFAPLPCLSPLIVSLLGYGYGLIVVNKNILLLEFRTFGKEQIKWARGKLEAGKQRAIVDSTMQHWANGPRGAESRLILGLKVLWDGWIDWACVFFRREGGTSSSSLNWFLLERVKWVKDFL